MKKNRTHFVTLSEGPNFLKLLFCISRKLTTTFYNEIEFLFVIRLKYALVAVDVSLLKLLIRC